MRVCGVSLRLPGGCAKLYCHPEPSGEESRSWLRARCRSDLSSISGIQNGGVDRMSGMSSILGIPLYRDVPSHHEPNERGERPLGTLPTQRDLNRGVAEAAENSYRARRPLRVLCASAVIHSARCGRS